MGIEANKARAVAFMTEFSSGDRVAAWKRATEDVTWTMNQHAIPGGDRITFNRKDYDAMVDSSGNLFPQGIKMNFTDAAADGDRVFLEANGRGPLADGRIYANHYVFTFRFRGDRISEIAEYLDTAYAQKLLAFTIETPKSP